MRGPSVRLGRTKRYLFTGVGVVLLFGALYFLSPGLRSNFNALLSLLVEGDIEGLRGYLLSFGIWAPATSFLLMILQSVIAPVPSVLITMTNGLLFGIFWGSLLSWGSAMVGAALCFGIARAFGRPLVEKRVGHKAVSGFDVFFKTHGKHAVLIARLIPVASFDLVSYGAGLTALGFWPFWIATGVGQAPATVLYSIVGERVGTPIEAVLWALAGLALLVAIGFYLRSRLKDRISV